MVVLVLAAIIYCKPKAFDIEMTMYSLEGESVHVILDVSWHKYLLKPSELKGRVIVDEQVYVSIVDGRRSIEKGNFFERLHNKLTGYSYSRMFWKDVIDFKESVLNNVTIVQPKGKYDVFYVVICNKDKCTIYFGPAKSVEEAESISDYFY